nr:hypothetical protein [Rhodocaloribacter litoris]
MGTSSVSSQTGASSQTGPGSEPDRASFRWLPSVIKKKTGMVSIRKRVRVQPGGVVSVQDASLPEGAEAEVIVRLGDTAEAEPPPLPLAGIVGSGPRLFASPEQIDQHLRTLRDEWD